MTIYQPSRLCGHAGCRELATLACTTCSAIFCDRHASGHKPVDIDRMYDPDELVAIEKELTTAQANWEWQHAEAPADEIGGLVYSATTHSYRYDAAYSDAALAWRRAEALTTGWHVPFAIELHNGEWYAAVSALWSQELAAEHSAAAQRIVAALYDRDKRSPGADDETNC